MAQLLVSVYRYDPRNILILRDDSRNLQFQPTKQNILRGIQWLVSNLVHGSHLVFHFSGAQATTTLLLVALGQCDAQGMAYG